MKTTEEWSDAFDTLVAQYIRMKNLDATDIYLFDEYEKSFFLTKAQEDIIKSKYSNNTQYFEDTEKTRRELDCVVTEHTLNLLKSNNVYTGSLLNDCMYIVFEEATINGTGDKCLDGKVIDVVPVTHDEYLKTLRNPFRGPNGNRALRVDKGNNLIELSSKYNLSTYFYRYIKYPTPIVLENFENEGLSINGITEKTTCALNESIHQDILERAVALAIQSRNLNNNK